MQRFDGRYIIATGHRRAGAQHVVRLLDYHEATLCRRNPMRTGYRPLAKLDFDVPFDTAPEAYLTQWRAAVDHMARHHNDADKVAAYPKLYIRKGLRRGLGKGFLRSPLRRRIAGIAYPPFLFPEWRLDPLYASPESLKEALPVFRLSDAHAGLASIFDTESKMSVIHVIRSPQASLYSWWSRHHIAKNPEGIYDLLKAQFHLLTDEYGLNPDDFATYSLENLVELELWWWRYANEIPIRRFSHSSRFMVMPLEAISEDPVAAARIVYRFSELLLRREQEDGIRADTSHFFVNTPRSGDLPPELVADCLDKVVSDSPLREIYPDGHAPGERGREGINL